MGLVLALVSLTLAAPELPPASEPTPPVESAPPPTADGSPPIQRPKSMTPPQPEPTPPVAADPPPVTPTPFDPGSSAPPVATPPPAAAAPPPALPETTDPFEGEPKPTERKISPTFRRPGVWLATGASFFALGTVLRFIFPTVTKVETRCVEGYECEDHEMTPGGIGILIVSVPVDAMTLISFGFAGRGYGFRGKDGHAKPGSIGAGVAFVVAGAALQIASFVVPFKSEKLDQFSYGIAGMREAAIVAGSAGAFLLGYGIALPAPRYAASSSRRRLVLAPSLGRTHVGVGVTIR